MKTYIRRFTVIIGIGLALLMSTDMALADADFQKKASEDFESLKKLSAEWWQWALSIPTSVNPQTDKTGENAVVGQRGAVWFLAGVFGGSTAPVTRRCSVPEGKVLFFPVVNDVEINTPNVCGSGPTNVSVNDLRTMSAANINVATNLRVTLDRKTITNLRRVKSKVFEVALPEENVFDSPCAGVGGVPAGIYSPAVSDGFYVRLEPLSVGNHTLHFHAESPSGVQDITYELDIEPVLRN
jgi:hypothetical protein